MLTITGMHVMRPRIVQTHANKDEFVPPTEAPGEGKRRPPTWDEGDVETEKKVNPIKKFIMKVFKIEEIDYKEFKQNDMWAIHPDEKKVDKE